MYRNTIGWLPGIGGGKKRYPIADQRQSRADDFNLVIKKVTDGKGAGEEVAKGNGSWLSHLQIDDEVIWRIDDEKPQWEELEERMSDGLIVLESDTRKRTDIQPMIDQEWHEAEQAKVALEEQ